MLNLNISCHVGVIIGNSLVICFVNTVKLDLIYTTFGPALNVVVITKMIKDTKIGAGEELQCREAG